MFRNYFITAIRNLKRNKAFSIINIMGLALGLMCSLFIWLWVKDERNMDKFNAHSSQIYDIYERQFSGGKIQTQTYTPGVLADEMKRVLPQVQYASGFAQGFGWSTNTFRAENKIINENGAFAGADFFKIFNYKLIEADAASALSTPADIAVSRRMATNFFGSPQNAIGKTIRFNNEKDFRISAVFEAPQNASARFDYLINWYSFLEMHDNMKSWDNTGVATYVMLKPGTDAAKFQQKITHFLNKYSQFSGDYSVDLAMQPFDEMYLYSNFNSQGYPEGGRITYVRIFSLVAIFILLIACINFMNLTTARSIKRAKEIGVRKVMGAFRTSLIAQFIGEAIIMAFISMIIAVALAGLLLPAFNQLIQKQIILPLSDVSFWINIIVISLITGIFSGSYPAIFLSSFNPVKVLKGKLRSGSNHVAFRKVLVVFQFVLSVILIIGTIIVSKQVNYIQTKDIGYNRDNLLYIPQDGAIGPKYELFKQEAMQLPGIKSISRISQNPTVISTATWGVGWEGKDPNFKPTFSDAGVGYEFAKTMNIQVLQGHAFSKEFATDSIGYILNEAAVKETGYKNPIGMPFTLWGRKATIVGVIKDFNFSSLHSEIKPLVLYLENNGEKGTLLVRTQAGKATEALAGLGKLWKQMNPEFPFSFQFADEAYNRLYKNDEMAGKLSHWFAALAIFISCLGLLGLVMFTAEQRTKEIGIRKVLGANVVSVFGLLSKEFLLLVVIALLIATPVAWLAMSKWLQGYAYHTGISWWIFLLAGGSAILIALITVSFQAIKAAVANPVEALRSE